LTPLCAAWLFGEPAAAPGSGHGRSLQLQAMSSHLMRRPWTAPIAAGAALLAALLGADAAPAKAAVQIPASVANFSSSITEQDAIKALDSVDNMDLRKIKFDHLEKLVHKGWWLAASKVIRQSHGARLDFTAPVRRAVQEVKKEADSLLRWLDPAFAKPAPTAMAVRWAQNLTSLMLAARFSPRWDGPGGANIAVFSSEKGRGHIDREKTEELVRKLLQVNITSSTLHAEITAETGNVRKRFLLSANLFDEAVPERSSWRVEFRRAQGSMQMSTGALIPELHMHIQKRWPELRQWPRLTVMPKEKGGLVPQWWAEAPGITEEQTKTMRESPARNQTPFTCSAGSSLYCRSSDSCVSNCDTCQRADKQHSTYARCVEPPSAAMVVNGSFVDEDLEPTALGGTFTWSRASQDVDYVDKYSLRWGSSTEQLLVNMAPIAETAAVGDLDPTFLIPQGTMPPADASHLLVVATNEAGEAVIVAAPIVDRVSPPPPRGGNFTDTDRRRALIGGRAKVVRASDETYVEAYELHFGRDTPMGPEVLGSDSLIGRVPTAALNVIGQAEYSSVEIDVENGTDVPPRATHLIGFAIGRGGVQSVPEVMKLWDAAPPTLAPEGFKVTSDANPFIGSFNANVTIDRMTCERLKAQMYSRGGVMSETREACDEGSHFVLYWVDPDQTIIGDAIAELSLSQANNFPLGNIEIPKGAKSLMVRSRNEHGEMPTGPTSKFKDDKSGSLRAWWKMRVLAYRTDGAAVVWRPFSIDRESKTLNRAFSGKGLTVLALDDLGYDGLAGKVDGSVACINLNKDKIWNVLEGPGVVTSLAFDGEGMQALRAARDGTLDLWDLNTGIAEKRLLGHTTDVAAMQVDWKGRRAITAALDGSVLVWDLKTGAASTKLVGHEGSVMAMSVSWDKNLVMTASKDESLRLWDLTNGKNLATLEGHSDPVKFVEVDWHGERALSVSEDKTAPSWSKAMGQERRATVKLWDLKTREVTKTFLDSRNGEVLALAVEWEPMQAMAIYSDGIAGLWDLQEAKGEVLDTSSVGDELKVAVIRSIAADELRKEEALAEAREAPETREIKQAMGKKLGFEEDRARAKKMQDYMQKVNR